MVSHGLWCAVLIGTVWIFTGIFLSEMDYGAMLLQAFFVGKGLSTKITDFHILGEVNKDNFIMESSLTFYNAQSFRCVTRTPCYNWGPCMDIFCSDDGGHSDFLNFFCRQMFFRIHCKSLCPKKTKNGIHYLPVFSWRKRNTRNIYSLIYHFTI